jgi:hypothetical protein
MPKSQFKETPKPQAHNQPHRRRQTENQGADQAKNPTPAPRAKKTD